MIGSKAPNVVFWVASCRHDPTYCRPIKQRDRRLGEENALLNGRVGLYFAKRWSIYVEGRNLTDKHYISTFAVAGVASASSELFNPGNGRSVFRGVGFTW